MVVGTAIGGYGGAHFARKMDPRRVRQFVILVGFVTCRLFLHRALR